MGLILSLLLMFSFVYGEDIFIKSETFTDFKKSFENLPIKEKLKIEIIENLKKGKENSAKTLFYLYKELEKSINPKRIVIENVLVIPKNKYSIVVAKDKQKLKIFTNDGKSIKEIFYTGCITGKRKGDKLKEGDQRTPNGVYFPMYFIPPHKLSEIYGNGAFPLNYPNIIDKKILHKTGDGIWIHGTNNDNRPPFSSNGCVVVKNSVFDNIGKYLIFKETPVIIVDKFSYIKGYKYNKIKKELIEFLYNWKTSWENTVKGRNLNKYFSLYSDKMISRYGSKKWFMKHKSRVAKQKRWIEINFSNIYISKDGRVLNFGNLYVISFDMEYKSNNYNWKGKKVLYIIKESGRWKILAEESL